MLDHWMSIQTKKEIGLVDVLEKLVIISAYGLWKKNSLQPFSPDSIQCLNGELEAVAQMKGLIENSPSVSNGIIRLLREIKDVRGSLERSIRDEILNEVELFEIKNQLMVMMEIRKLLLKEERISIEKVKLMEMDDIVKLLDPENSGMRTFYIYDQYSTLLTDIRDKIANIEKQMWILKKKNKRVLEKDSEASIPEYIDEDLNRLTLALDQLKMQEEEEELRIRQWLSQEIKNHYDIIFQNIHAIGELDFILSKARFAIESKSVRPEITQNQKIRFVEGRHIPLESHLKEKGAVYTPVDIKIHKGVTVITGANMGGKTISLKLIALITAMAQLGFYVPAKSATVGLFDFIYFSSGDQQSLQSGLSTFGGEIHGISQVLGRNGEKGLLLIDELARGTNPMEGYGISKGIITYLKKSTFISIITTHFDGLSNMEDIQHLQVVGLKNINLEEMKRELSKVDGKKQVLEKYMDYRLEEMKSSAEVPRDAILVARLMGLNEEILNIAKEAVSEANR